MSDSLAEFARRQIQEWIVTGRFEAGRKIGEEEVCARLGISRPPVREAFKVLEAEGLIVRKPRRGVFVSHVTAADAREVYSLKAVLYEMAVAAALPLMTAEQLRRLEELVRQMESCVQAESLDTRAYQSLHESFHSIIIMVAGNRRLQKFVDTLHNQVSRLSYHSLRNATHLAESVQYHRAIIEALKRRDEKTTCRLMKEHVMAALEVLVEMQAAAEAARARPHKSANRFNPDNPTDRIYLHTPNQSNESNKENPAWPG